MRKILVTGATGFVGKEVCNILGNHDIPFVAGVRRTTNSNQIEVGDLSAATNWTRALAGCDIVIHLAARVHVMKDKAEDPLRLYREINVNATVNLATQAAMAGVRRFIFLSSIKVNGETTTDKPFSSYDQPAPRDAYGLSKFEAEQALTALSKQSGMELVIVRPPLVYGPGVRANFFQLMKLVKHGFPLPFRNVRSYRSLIALDNLVHLLIQCVSHPRAAGNIFLASDDNDLSISELIQMIAKSMNKRPLLFPMPVQLLNTCAAAIGKSDVATRVLGSLQVDIAKTKEILNWQPIVKPNVAIERTVADFLQQG